MEGDESMEGHAACISAADLNEPFRLRPHSKAAQAQDFT